MKNGGRRLKIGAIALSCAIGLVGAIGGTYAWFTNNVSVPSERIEGTIRGAYFAYGDGKTKDTAYGIETPRQLYNLAWLQYAGFFNRDLDEDGKYDTFYFELSDKVAATGLDMTGYVLPPIGTERFPFLGEFDGNGKIVKNLTVSNQYSDYGAIKPTTVLSTNYVQPQIVGFFGVIGSLPNPTYTYDSAANKFYDTGLVNVNVKTVTASSLIGVAAGYVNGDISGVAVDASNANISAGTSKALSYTTNLSDHGVIGYVAKAGRKNTIKRIRETIYDINVSGVNTFNANDQGNTAGFGGSIDMKELYNRLFSIWESCTNDTSTLNDDIDTSFSGDIGYAKYATLAQQSISKAGVAGEIAYNETQSLGNASAVTGTEGNYFTSRYGNNRAYYNVAQKDTDNYVTASYGFIVEPGGITTGTRDFSSQDAYAKVLDEGRYMCLTGERNIPFENGATLSTTYYESTTGSYLYYVTDGGTRNYLNYNGTDAPQNVVAASDESSDATLWTFADNKLSFKIYSTTNSSSTTYYLNCSDAGALSITTTNGTNWAHDGNGYYATVNSTKHYLGFNGTEWTTTIWAEATEEESYWLISSGTTYATHVANVNGAGNVGNAVSSSQPTGATYRWYLVDGNYFSATNSGTLYYLYADSFTGKNNNRRGTPRYSNNVNASSRFVYNGTTNEGTNSGTLSMTNNNTRYYLALNNGSWSAIRTQTNLTFRKVITQAAAPARFTEEINAPSVAMSEGHPYYANFTSTSTSYHGGNPDKVTSYAKTAPTYMPLKEKETKVNNVTTITPGVPDPYNTGYIVSGAKYYNDPYGDIRVSVFPLFDKYEGSWWDQEQVTENALGNSSFNMSTGALGTVYTVNASGATATPAATETYTNSKTSLQTDVLKKSNYVYGLHFMNAKISNATEENPYGTDAKHIANKVGQSVRAGKAVFNDEIHYNYELPTDCIDFHLKEKGYINFFAGTYYTDNSSFFSLYEIVRDEDTQDIVQLRKISEVYSDAATGQTSPNSYMYKYDKAYTYKGVTGQYSVPFKYQNSRKVTLASTAQSPINYVEHSVQNSVPTGYSSVFKTEWIEGKVNGSNVSLTKNAAYYFEIAMNDGEYALGSVEGKAGAYLMYLDIGANAAKTERTILSEHMYIEESEMEYPLGVAIVSSPSTLTETIKTNNQEHNYLACVEIEAGHHGVVSFAVNATDSSQDSPQIDITGYVENNAVPVFQGENIELNIAEKLKPKELVTKDIKRLEYLDYSVNNMDWTRVVIDFTSTNGGAYERSIKWYGADGVEITEATSQKVYRTKTGQKFFSLDDITYANLTLQTDDGLYYSNTSTTSIMTYQYWETSTVTGESAYWVNVTKGTNSAGETTFSFQGYAFSVTASGGTLTIEVLALGNRAVSINGTPVNAVGQTITVRAS